MDILISVGLPLGLAFIMFSLGVGLTVGDFVRVSQRPGAFFVGGLNQMILLPLIAFFCIRLFVLTDELAVGVMILSACPGGVTSNIITRLAKGDVALSVSLTAVISLASVVTVPLILAFALSTFMGADAPPVNIAATALTMFALTVVPVLLGLSARHIAPTQIVKAEPYLARAATILFVLIISSALAASWSLFVANIPRLGPVLVLLLTLLTAIGFALPRFAGRTKTEAKTISIETGVQNGTLGIAIASLLIGEEAGFSAYALPSAVYGIVMYLIIVPVILVYRRMD
ncbi:bile acid:sodium symporter family protein [Aestuariibius insulae]|uniref:bile acid:sodium symporter family protein n=1 Tax=Aestuariibius insulae TaxID=2058287 RepID=UPI00345E69E9